MSKRIELTGKKFGSWTVVAWAGSNENSQSTWFCRCVCGVERVVVSQPLRAGLTVSCGCQKSKAIAEALWKHGQSESRGSHTSTWTAEYRAWTSMWRRCSPGNRAMFSKYYGRGIRICDEWQDFDRFLVDMGKIPYLGFTLDRIHNDKGYEPDNCRWTDAQQQAINRRSSRKEVCKPHSSAP